MGHFLVKIAKFARSDAEAPPLGVSFSLLNFF